MMRRTQRQLMIEEIESGMGELASLGCYADPNAIAYWSGLPWEERKNFVAHSALKVMVSQLKKDLKTAKASRYDTIAPHYEQLLLAQDS